MIGERSSKSMGLGSHRGCEHGQGRRGKAGSECVEDGNIGSRKAPS